jgi:hypothetical protein
MERQINRSSTFEQLIKEGHMLSLYQYLSQGHDRRIKRTEYPQGKDTVLSQQDDGFRRWV